MDVHNATPADLLQGTKQYRVPIWQRQYTWRLEQHAQLWRDLLHQHDLVAGGQGDAVAGHFLGSFVLAPVSSSGSGVVTLQVIDGQQRLTTLMLLLCALRDVAAEDDPQAREEFDDTYLLNKYKQGDQHFSLRPTLEDRDAFDARVRGLPDEGAGDAISEAYRFFLARLREPREDGARIDPRAMAATVAERLAIVEINTGRGDNAHRIFQSLNGTGVKLGDADLLRNHVFMLLPTRAERVYEELWRPIERLLGVEHLEGLARVDLQRRGIDARKGDVFRLHEQDLRSIEHDEDAIEERIADLRRQAGHYKRLIDPVAEQDAELREGLARLSRWGAQTSHPVLMVALDLRERGVLPVEELRRVVAYVESYLVRRQLVRVPPNALNRSFVQLVGRLPRDASFADALHRELSRERLDWPDDEAVRRAIKTERFFHIGRHHQRKMILERIERSYEHPERIDFDASTLEIEHIMPQTLTSEWRAQLGEDADAIHSELVHTLGNLTLTAFNGTLSNNPFQRKQEIYGASHLELNRVLANGEVWGREQILARADALAQRIASIWPAPLPGIVDAPRGFDWTRVDAAMAAIPAGRWTAYGDLAELGGTSAQPVGNHVLTLGPDTHAYRVLLYDGTVADNFRWRDRDDRRDVRAVLAAEGVRFDAAGRAEQAQRIGAAQLAALIDTPDDEAAPDASAVDG